MRRTRRAALPTSSASMACTNSANPLSGFTPAAARRAASSASRRKIRGTTKPCDSSSRRQSSRISGSREACVCTKSSGRPGANAATSRATIQDRYFCAVATSKSTSHAGSTASSRSRLRLVSLGRGPADAGCPRWSAAEADCVSGSGQSTSTILATAGALLRTTLASIASSGSHELSISLAMTTTGCIVVGLSTSPAGLTSPPANALTSVLLPVPVPPITPTTNTRDNSRLAESRRGSTCCHSRRTWAAGAHPSKALLQPAIAAMSSSNAEKSTAGSGTELGMCCGCI